MSHAYTRTVQSLAPVVERALNTRDAREALGPARSSGREPRGSGARTGWSAAHHVGERLSGQRHPMAD